MADTSTDGAGQSESEKEAATWAQAVRGRTQRPTVNLSQQPTLSTLETDRICMECGYNLRQQSIKREPSTQLLLVQCPECGSLSHAEGSDRLSWLTRTLLVKGLLVTWFAVLVALTWLFVSVFYVAGHLAVEIEMPPSRAGAELRWLFYLLVYGFTFAAGLLVVVVLYMLLPHWHRKFQALAVGVMIVAGVALTWLELTSGYYYYGDDIERMSIPFLGMIALTGVLGVVIGATVGRSVARGLIRIWVPPSFRPLFAYLWLADGKAFPAMSRGLASRVIEAVDLTEERGK